MLTQSFDQRFCIKSVQLFSSNCFRQIFWPTRFGPNLLDQILWPQLLDQIFWSNNLAHPVFWPTLLDQIFWSNPFFKTLAHPVFNRIFSTKSSWPSRLIKSNQICFPKSNMLLKIQTNSSTNITSASTYFTLLRKNKLYYLLYTSFWKIIDFNLFHTS